MNDVARLSTPITVNGWEQLLRRASGGMWKPRRSCVLITGYTPPLSCIIRWFDWVVDSALYNWYEGFALLYVQNLWFTPRHLHSIETLVLRGFQLSMHITYAFQDCFYRMQSFFYCKFICLYSYRHNLLIDAVHWTSHSRAMKAFAK